MPVRVEADGRRAVEAEVKVPGTANEVWKAIATGPGVSSWFVPTTIDGRDGGTIIANFGPRMDSRSTITAWMPPHRFTAVSHDLGPEAPPLETEWTVEVRSGGMCRVRVIHRWQAETSDWDRALEGVQQGWAGFFRILRLHLTHFRGSAATPLQVMGASAQPTSEAWNAFTGALGIAGAEEGDRLRTSRKAPKLVGIVEHVGPAEYPEYLVRLDEPLPGIAHVFAMPMGGQVLLPVRLYLHGEGAAAVVAREAPRWEEWMARRSG